VRSFSVPTRARPALSRKRPPMSRRKNYASRKNITTTAQALKLVPCGDGSTDHLPKGTRVPPSLLRTEIKLPTKKGSTITVGREKPNDFLLPIGSVSGRHCSFLLDAAGETYVTDNNSVNGTQVNGRNVKPGSARKIAEGDIVTLGDPHLAKFEVVEFAFNKKATGDPLASFQNAFAGVAKGVAEAEKTRKSSLASIQSARDAIAGAGDVFRVRDGHDAKDKLPSRDELEDDDDVEFENVSGTIDVGDDASTFAAEVVPELGLNPKLNLNTLNTNKSPLSPEVVEMTDGSFASTSRVIFVPVGWPGPAIDLEPGVEVVVGTGKKKGDAGFLLTNVQGVDSKHCVLLRNAGQVYITDLNSQAGTFVGGRQIKPGLQYALVPGADVQIGDGGCVFTIKTDSEDGGTFFGSDGNDEDEMPLPRAMGGGALVLPRKGNEQNRPVIRNADLSLHAVDDGSDPAASPWGLMGGLKGMGENLGAAIFNRYVLGLSKSQPCSPIQGLTLLFHNNSKIQVNYQYKPSITVGGAGKAAGLSDLKSALLLSLADTERGLRADKERVKKIEQFARALEAKNPTRSPLKSPLMNGRWALQYTSEIETLGSKLPNFLRPKGAIYQTVDIFTLQVLNETAFEPLPFVKFKNRKTLELSAQTDSRAGVRPKDWRVAGIKMNAPPESAGRYLGNREMEASGAGSMAWMDTTFVDGELRISRSQSGDLFILVRDDPNDE